MSLKLNEKSIIEEVFESIPIDNIAFVCHEFPQYYLKNFIKFISYIFERKPHLEFQMSWILYLLTYHGKFFKTNSLAMIESLRNLQKCIAQNYNNLSQVCDDNKYTLDYFEQISIFNIEKQEVNVKVEKEEPTTDSEEEENEEDGEEEEEEEEEEQQQPLRNKKIKSNKN
ncbi:WD40 repeat-containing protein [Heterostelium album PN500]|uniref:WD40 repeat-containing protein n=1 Tax=Heterostelium pallidum (strain ATCC 26659 / Pp 5 / PN500) TaxID=670386 RepID=D3BQX0_HETP5|nr:WD40 repeat-containing protein [Heterostelium album PN500]EFA76156.1 WD40 repeat-containing protein [Heterostelium album PN500]|eukprot:XP_020428290.1 WD40 repeat-containing protein [Heterostelium album PN500]